MPVSLECAPGAPKFESELATLREPPNRSLWISCCTDAYNGPASYFTPMDHNWPLSSLPTSLRVSSGLYWMPAWKAPNSGVWYWMVLVARSWKRAALLLPTPICDRTLLGEMKLPLVRPNSDSTWPYSL